MADREVEDIKPAKNAAREWPTISRDMVRRWLTPFELPDWEESTLAEELSLAELDWRGARDRLSRDAESAAQYRRIAQAVAVLNEEFPLLIADQKHGRTRVTFITIDARDPNPPNPLDELLWAVQRMASVASLFCEHGGKERWHMLARRISHILRRHLASAGIAQAWMRKAEIGFVQAALAEIGIKAQAEAIRKALK